MGFPLGLLSEGGAEAAHRIRKNARLNHTRKCGRIEEMWDLLVWDMIRSDPVIAKRSAKISGMYRKTELAAYIDLPSAAKRLLCVPAELIRLLEVNRGSENSGNPPRRMDENLAPVGAPLNAVDTTGNQNNDEDASDGEENDDNAEDTGDMTSDSDTESDTDDFGPQTGALICPVAQLLGEDSDTQNDDEMNE